MLCVALALMGQDRQASPPRAYTRQPGWKGRITQGITGRVSQRNAQHRDAVRLSWLRTTMNEEEKA